MTSSSFAGAWSVWTEEEFPWLRPNSVQETCTNETTNTVDIVATVWLLASLQFAISDCQRRIARLLCVEATLQKHTPECPDLETLRVKGLSVVRHRLGELHGECTASGVHMLSLEMSCLTILDAAESAARNHPLGCALCAQVRQTYFVSNHRQNVRLLSMRCLRHILTCCNIGTSADVSEAAFKDVDAVQRCLFVWTRCFLQGMRSVHLLHSALDHMRYLSLRAG